MDKAVREFCKEGQNCEQTKIIKHIKSEVQPFKLPSDHFQTVHFDMVGPLPPVRNQTDFLPFRYLLTMIIRTTRWVEAVLLSEITAQNVTTDLINPQVARFRVPLYIITDRGSQFELELFSELSKIIGFHRLRTTLYHPQVNGLIECDIKNSNYYKEGIMTISPTYCTFRYQNHTQQINLLAIYSSNRVSCASSKTFN